MSATETIVRTPRKKERLAPTQRQVTRRSAAGKDLGKVDLEPSVFGIVPNEAVLHQVVTAQLAAARSGTQSTRTRAEVRGGGAKPFRQKGTGRARAGSTRSPIWSGGGVALGPKPRSYRQRVPKKMVRLALFSALSDRAAEDRVALVDNWGFQNPKTKDAVAALGAIGVSGRVLVVLTEDDIVADRSFGNLKEIQTLRVGELNAYDILRNDWIVFTDETLPGAQAVVAVDDDEEVEVAAPAKRAASTRKAKAVAPAPEESKAQESAADVSGADDGDAVASAEADAPGDEETGS
jgi:large subunit ribosomal protein L4